MNSTTPNSKLVGYATAIVVLHTLVTLVHGAAHVSESVYGSVLDTIFIVVVIWFAPIAAILLLRMRRWQMGSIILLVAMAGSLLYGVYNHFILPGPDNVVSFPAGPWQGYFQITAVLLAIIEAAGTLLGLALVLRNLTRRPEIDLTP